MVRQAVAAAAITTRDLVLTQITTFTAGMADVAVRAGAKPPTAPAAAANLRLYQQNRAELEQITVRLNQLASVRAFQGGDAPEDSDD